MIIFNKRGISYIYNKRKAPVKIVYRLELKQFKDFKVISA